MGSISVMVGQHQDSADEPVDRAPSADLGGLLCPICQELYNDPVVTVDGHSYCRKCITEWFGIYDRQKRQPREASGDESVLPLLAPATQLPLACRALLQNVALRASVNTFAQTRESWVSCDRERRHLSKRVRSLEDEIRRLRRQASDQEKLVTQALASLIVKDVACPEKDQSDSSVPEGEQLSTEVQQQSAHRLSVQDSARPLRQRAQHSVELGVGRSGLPAEAPQPDPECLEQLCGALRRQECRLRETACRRGEELRAAVTEAERLRVAAVQQEAERGHDERLLGSLRDQIDRQASELSEGRQEVERLEAELRRSIDQLSESEATAAESEATAARLGARAREEALELRACREDGDSLRARAEQRLRRHRREFDEFEASLASKDAELRSGAALSSEARAEARAEAACREEELRRAGDELAAVSARAAAAGSELRASASECARLRAAAELSAAAAEEKERGLRSQAAELAGARNELAASWEEARQTSSECSEMGAEVQRLRQEVSQEQQEASTQRSAADAELQLLRRAVAERQAEVQAASAESSMASVELQLQQSEAARRGSELQEARLECSATAARLELLQDEAAQREAALLEARTQWSTARAELEQLRHDAVRREAQLRHTQEELAAGGSGSGAAAKQVGVDEKDDALRGVCKAGVPEAVRPLVAASANVNRADPDGVTALHIASISGHSEVVHELLLTRANVNAKDVQGWTPLYVASFTGHNRVVRALLAARADQHTAVQDGSTPLDMARQRGTRSLANSLQS